MLCHKTQIPGFHHDNPYELLEAMKEKKDLSFAAARRQERRRSVTLPVVISTALPDLQLIFEC
jgi:hypothetical protein